MQLADIDYEIGSVNPSGIADELFFIEKSSIKVWPTVDDELATATNVTDYTVMDGDFTLNTGKVWHRLYNTQGKGKATWEYTGETDCKVPVNKAEMKYPRITDEIRAFCKYASNGDFVFCIKHDSKYFIIGSKDYRATVTPTGATGDAAGSDKGVTIAVECPDVTPLPRYNGDIVLSDGTLACDTGVFTPIGGGGGAL